MMAEEMNRWGGGGVTCIVCTNETVKPTYVGRLKCCKERVGLCQECKPGCLRAGFSTPAAAVQQWALMHSFACPEKRLQEADKFSTTAKKLYQDLTKICVDTTKTTGLTRDGVQTALIMLCRAFCSSAGVPLDVFASNFLTGLEEAKAVEEESESGLN